MPSCRRRKSDQKSTSSSISEILGFCSAENGGGGAPGVWYRVLTQKTARDGQAVAPVVQLVTSKPSDDGA